MANIKSQQKRILTNERRRLRNKSVKSSLHTAVRAFREAAAEGDKAKAGELLVSTSRKLDKAASKGVIHKNQAANKKSALAAAFLALIRARLSSGRRRRPAAPPGAPYPPARSRGWPLLPSHRRSVPRPA